MISVLFAQIGISVVKKMPAEYMKTAHTTDSHLPSLALSSMIMRSSSSVIRFQSARMCQIHSVMFSLRAIRMYCFTMAISIKLSGPIIRIFVSRLVSTRMVQRIHGINRKHIKEQLITVRIIQVNLSIVLSQRVSGHMPIGFRNHRFNWIVYLQPSTGRDLVFVWLNMTRSRRCTQLNEQWMIVCQLFCAWASSARLWHFCDCKGSRAIDSFYSSCLWCAFCLWLFHY